MATVIHLENVLRSRDAERAQRGIASLRRLPPPGSLRWFERAERYRHRAEQLRAIVADVILFETKQTLLSLALSYEHMADTMERTHRVGV
jgi:hypothetical protein